MDKVISHLNKLVEESSIDNDFIIASALLYKKDIIASGTNLMKSSPFQKKWSKNEFAIFFHAETRVIHSALSNGFDKFSKSTLYVYRLKWDSWEKRLKIFANATPCSGCIKCIKHFGIRNVRYTLDGDECNNHFGLMKF